MTVPSCVQLRTRVPPMAMILSAGLIPASRAGEVPRHAVDVAHQRVAESAVELDAGHTAGPVVDIDAWDADVLGGGGAIIAVQRVAVIMRHAHTELADQRGRKDAVVVDAHAVGLLNAGALERALREAAGQAKNGRLGHYRAGVAKARAEAGPVGGAVVHLDVERAGVLGEGKQHSED